MKWMVPMVKALPGPASAGVQHHSKGVQGLIVGLLLATTTSCAATVGNANLVTMLPGVRLDQPGMGENNIFVDFRDLTATGDLRDEVFDALEEAVEASGWDLVDYHDQADYVLLADLRLFDEAGTKAGNKAIAELGGFASGVAIGAATYKVTDNWWLGAGVGGVGGMITDRIIEWMMRKQYWQMVVDVELGQRVEGGVETERRQEDTTAIITLSGIASPQGGEAGVSKAQGTKSQSTTEVRVHLEMQQRLVASAGGTRCTKAMAQEELVPKLIKGVRNQLPRIRNRN